MNDSMPHQRVDRTQLQQIIAGLTEGVIFIEPDQTIAWANETALRMHGVRALVDLGGSVDAYRRRFELRYRNRHKIAEGDYPMDRVIAGEAFSEVIVEVGRPGEKAEWTHRIRSLVLNNTAGEPDCLVLVLNDETERFGAEERFERTFNANPAPAVICRLADLRYVKVNKGFQEMTGYSREDVIGRSVYEIDVLEAADGKDAAIACLNEGRTISQTEACLTLPGGSSKYVIVAGQPIEMGDEACMLFTFMDLEPRKRAESALKQSEERFAKSFKLAPVPTILSSLDRVRILDVNEAFTAVTAYAPEDVIGRTAAEVRLFATASVRQAFEAPLAKTGTVRNLDIQIRSKEGDTIDCLLSADTVSINDQTCVLIVLQDITERKRSETDLIEAIETVMRDTSWFSRTVIEKLASLRQPRSSGAAKAAMKDLTPRERDVLGLLCQGHADDAIAESLGLSRNTIRNQVSAIYHKIGLHRRSAVIVWARERGFTGAESITKLRDQASGKTLP
jgi:PAS domain S-box-containing protein